MQIKPTTKIITFFIIPAIIVAILVYDVCAIMAGGTEASISSLIITSAYQMPFMVFCIGFFMGLVSGHLFWRMRGNQDTRKSGIDDKEE